MEQADPYIGRTIGSYRILSKLGEGGMGAVFKAVHSKLDREVAFKVLPEHLVRGNPQFLERFFVEARAAAKVMHPNVVQVHDAEDVDGVYYIAMEFVRGMDVKDLLAQKSPLSEKDALDLIVQAAKGLDDAHRHGIIHRDIKPANLMLTPEGVLKIADFGLAKNLDEDSELTRSGQVMGTPAYMSPEQGDGQKVDFRSDMYSLGVCLFEMVVGQKPYLANSAIGLIKKHCLDPVPDPRKLNPDIHPAVSAVIQRMMAKTPDERFPSYQNLVEELEAAGAALDSGAPETADLPVPAPQTDDSLSDIYAIVEQSLVIAEQLRAKVPGKSDGTATPMTLPASEVPPPAVKGGLRPVHMALAGLGGAVVLGAVLAVLFAAGVFRQKEGGGDKPHAPESSDQADRPDGKGPRDRRPDPVDRAKARAERRAEKIRGILEQVSILEKEKRYDDALAVLSRAVALDPNHAEVLDAGRRIRTALDESRSSAQREEAYKRYFTEADLARIRAEGSGKASDWALVVESAEKARANRDTKEILALISKACGSRDLALARDADGRGDLEEALRLVDRAGTHGAAIPGLKEFHKTLTERRSNQEQRRDKRKAFLRLIQEAEEFQNGNPSNTAKALSIWKKALALAEHAKDQQFVKDRIDALEARGKHREGKRLREVTLAAAKNAFNKGDLATAERLYKKVLSFLPGDREATRGLNEVLKRRSSSEQPVKSPFGAGKGLSGIFNQRTGGGRRRFLLRHGGSRASEAAVDMGLRWLSGHQDPDGAWSSRKFMANCKEGTCTGYGSTEDFDTGVTGLALLAFLGAGHTHRAGRFKTTVAKALEALIRRQESSGLIGGKRAERWIYNQAIATQALAEAYGMTRDPQIKEPAQKAAAFLESCRNPGKGWRYGIRPGESDSSCTAWAVQALVSAGISGLKVSGPSFRDAYGWFEQATDRKSSRTGYLSRHNQNSHSSMKKHYKPLPTLTAAAMFCRTLLGCPPEDPKLRGGSALLMRSLPQWDAKGGSLDMCYWYFGTCFMFQLGGASWKTWNSAVKKILLSKQRTVLCASGSWDPVGFWGSVGGRVYATALNVLTLEVYYRYPRLRKK